MYRESKSLIQAFLCLALIFCLNPAQAESESPESGKALAKLAEGNRRFAEGRSVFPNIDRFRRTETSREGQRPFATIITCSDSRVPVEILFDQGIGELFVIRVAGNVCDTDEIGSIEYGVDHLSTPLFVVLGHTHCGAVTAVVNNAELHGSIPALVDNIIPAVEKAGKKLPGIHGDDLVPEAIRANVWQSIEDLLNGSSAVAYRIRQGKTRAVGALYDLDTGIVEWLGPHPEQDKLLEKSGGGGKH